jgi:hypothetical protein
MRSLAEICEGRPTVDEAIALAERAHPDLADGATLPGDHATQVAGVLAAEVRRLRAALRLIAEIADPKKPGGLFHLRDLDHVRGVARRAVGDEPTPESPPAGRVIF